MNTITADEAREMIEKSGVVIIDVRTPAEYGGGHIYGARNIDIHHSTFEEQIRILDPSASYLVYCELGGRSSKAVSRLNELGFSNVHNLAGGITAWKKSGLPVEK